MSMFDKTIDLTGNAKNTSVYVCFARNNALFDASKKFDAGCGFPSFWSHANNAVNFTPLNTYNRSPIQLLCNYCGAHLGHLFSHKQTPTGLRYCINHGAIKFDCGNKYLS